MGIVEDFMDCIKKDVEQFDFSEDEKLIAYAILKAREVQEFLWDELSLQNNDNFDMATWIDVFQKRVYKIAQIDVNNPSYKVELRKRILQQATLSIAALKLLNKLK